MDNSIDVLCQQFKRLLQSQRLSHAHLIECPIRKPADDAIRHITALAVCSSLSDCGNCQSCSMLSNQAHPDVITLSNAQQSIKVADIRALTQYIYQAPKIATYRLVVIENIDQLNRSAANAILKMLEEPPKHVIFILSCENTSRVIPTIRSRTVHWHLPIQLVADYDWKQLQKWLVNDEGKKQLIGEKSKLIEQLNAVYDKHQQPANIAQTWQQYPTSDLLWFLYILHAWALRQNHVDRKGVGYFSNNKLLLEQLQQIHAMIKLVSKGIALNNILMFETLLMNCQGTEE